MKGKSIIDAVVIFAILQLVLIIPQGVRDLIRWENHALGGSYLTGLLLVALPVFVIIVRRYEFRLMGLTVEDWRTSVNAGFRGWLFFIIPQLVLSFFGTWGIRIQDNWRIAVFMSAIIGVMVVLNCRGEKQAIGDRKLAILLVILVAPIALSFFIGTFSLRLVKEFAWNILVGGFAEEFFYRGYIQSSVNQEYGRNWKMGKVSFGPGLIVSSILYGASRGMRTMKPWSGVYSFSLGWSLFAFTVGVFYGLIRESTGDILASGTANSMIDAIGEALLRAVS